MPSKCPRGGLDIHFGDAERDSVRDVHVLGGGAGSDIGTAIALLGSINNRLSFRRSSGLVDLEPEPDPPPEVPFWSDLWG